METEYLDEEQVIALYNKVRTGKRTWPADIWSSPAALQYAVTIFDYWIHNVMGWKGWPDSRGKVTPALLEEHRLADLVESVFVPEFGDDWLDFEVVLNESMRLSEDDKAERESAEKFWTNLRLVRSTRGHQAEAWSIVNAEDERRGEVTMVWGEPHPYCLVVLDPEIEAGSWEQVIYRLEQEILVEEPGDVSYAVWHKGFVGEFYRCADCGELHSQFDEDAGSELRLNDLEPPEDR